MGLVLYHVFRGSGSVILRCRELDCSGPVRCVESRVGQGSQERLWHHDYAWEAGDCAQLDWCCARSGWRCLLAIFRLLLFRPVSFAVSFLFLDQLTDVFSRSPYNPGSKDARRTRAEKGYYSYERVGSPYPGPQGQQAVPLNNMGPSQTAPQRDTATAYEPFRPQRS